MLQEVALNSGLPLKFRWLYRSEWMALCNGLSGSEATEYSDKALNRSLPHACRVRKVCSTGHILHFKRYLPLLEVDFVRASGWTVLPFPFKYLREWMAKQH